MRRLILLCSVFLVFACAKSPAIESPIVEHTKANGGIVMELPTEQTFDRAELPTGIDAKDVAAVITLKDDPITIFDSQSSTVKFDKVKTPKAARRIVVKKDGTITAGAEAEKMIERVEDVKPSYSWLYWVIALLVALGIIGYAVKKRIGK